MPTKGPTMKITVHADDPAHIPTRATEHAAGYDLRATHPVCIVPEGRATIATGVTINFPPGVHGEIRPRSGHAVRSGVDILAGVIDGDYRGEIKAVLVNHGRRTVTFDTGDRIAQLVFRFTLTPELVPGDVTDTARGVDGFGSTGAA